MLFQGWGVRAARLPRSYGSQETVTWGDNIRISQRHKLTMLFSASRVNNQPQLINIWTDILQCDFNILVLVILDPLICNVMHESRGRLPFRLFMSLIF